MANTYLSRTQSASPTSATKGTLSFWIKRSLLGVSQYFMSVFQDSNNRVQAEFQADDTLRIIQKNSSSTTINIITNRVFRDSSSWYHVVLAFDTTQGTDSNRVKLYINGVQETSFSTSTYPGSGIDSFLTKGTAVSIGAYNGTGDFTNGLMSHIHLCDGIQYQASDFGETDATTGEWKGKTSPSVTYGTNGFFILKDGNSVTDQSGRGNNFTVGGGTLTDLKDNPDNVFATFNPLLDVNAKPTLSNGNTTMAGAAISSAQFAGSTICVSNGKWYFEAKVTPNSSSPYVGVIDAQSTLRKNANYFVHTASGTNQSGYAVNMSGDIYHNNSNSYAANIGSISSGDILGFAIDLDSAQRTCEIYKNGASQRSFNLDEPTSGAYMLGCCSSYNTASASVNFGNGFFGTTAITTNSGNGYSGAEGSSKFNYTVPAGYSALSTKGLNE
jgi:hypothetical protein